MEIGMTLQPCDRCFKLLVKEEQFTSVYDFLLCPECWDDYLCTDAGKVEYIISIVKGECKIEHFDADFLGDVAVQWEKHKHEFDLSQAEIQHIESQAKKLGLL